MAEKNMLGRKLFMLKIALTLLALFLACSFCAAFYVKDVKAASNSFEEQLAQFPESYQAGISAIHENCPNFVFQADYVDIDFEELVDAEIGKKVYRTLPPSWKAMYDSSFGWYNNYNWSNGEWTYTEGNFTYASREVISYYIDPRNFLDSQNVYMFVQQSYTSDQNIEGVRTILATTFMKNNYTPNPDDPDDVRLGGDYAKVIMEAAEKSGVNPYVIAGIIIWEQSNQGSPLSSGTFAEYPGYYNFFNYGATGTTSYNVICNGLEFAKKQGWNSRYKSIVGGAIRYSSSYVGNKQDTYYYMDFNVLNGMNNLWHQYATNVEDAYDKASVFRRAMGSYNDTTFTVRIPVYKNMKAAASEKPEKSDALNNYAFLNITAQGGTVTPSYTMANHEYSLSIGGNASIIVSMPDGSEFVSETVYQLPKGTTTIELVIRSQTGYCRSYYVDVAASAACRLNIKGTGLPEIKQLNGTWVYAENDVIRDDFNGLVYGEVNSVLGNWKIKDGIVDLGFNGIYTSGNEGWLIKNGCVNTSYTGIARGASNTWWRVVNGKVDYGCNSIEKNEYGWWYIRNGQVDFNYTGIARNKLGWWRIENGKVNFDFNGFAENEYGWWFVENGKVTFEKNSIIKGVVNDETGWWYVRGSQVRFIETIEKNENGWWYVKDGKVDFTNNSIKHNSNGWWKIENGRVTFTYNGFAENENGWWYVEDSKVTFKVNDILKGKVNSVTGWWYVVDSKVVFTETVAKNALGWWYVRDGMVDLTCNSIKKNGLGWWKITNGKVDFDCNTVAKNEYGWWYVRNGKVDFTYTGVADNEYGSWRIENGKVNFEFTGLAENEDGWWYLENGKVNYDFNGQVQWQGKTYIVVNGQVQ